MKICDITMFYADGSGGVRTYLHRKSDFLTGHRGWEHILIVPGKDNEVIRNTSQQRIYTVRGPFVPAHHPYRFLLNPWRVRQILKAESPDLIELGCAYFEPWVLRLALPNPRPILTGFYHDDFPSTYVRGYGYPIGKWAANALEALAWAYARLVYRRCDLILAASTYVAEKLIAHGISPVTHTPLGVDLYHFRPDRRSKTLRERWGIDDHCTLLLYVGRLSYEKGIDYLLNAFQSLPRKRYCLVVAGDGPERGKLETFAQKHANVIYLGYCADPEDLANLYASCDLFIAPGCHETFGLTVLEAFASGLPVIGVDRGAVSELVRQGGGAIADPDDPTDLAVKIEQLCTEDLQTMGLKSRARIAPLYDWENAFGLIANIYEKQINMHRKAICLNRSSYQYTT